MATVTKKTRPVRFFNIPGPTNITAKGVYNFFTPDEREVAFSSPRILETYHKSQDIDEKVYYDRDGNQIREHFISGQVPRYIEISVETIPDIESEQYDPNILEDFFLDGDFIKPEELQSPFDISYSFKDSKVSQRLQKKLSLLSKLKDISMYEEQEGNSIPFINSIGNLSKNQKNSLMSVLNQNMSEGSLDLDSKGDEISRGDQAIQDTKRVTCQGVIDRRYFEELVDSNINKNLFLSTYYKDFKKKNDENIFLPDANDPDLDDAILVGTEVDGIAGTNVSIKRVGYYIERYTNESSLIDNEPEKTFIVTTESNHIIDTNVKYGKLYSYNVRIIYHLTWYGYVDINNERSEIKSIDAFFVSKSGETITDVSVVDNNPPAEPDGLFFDFNYEKEKGLFLRWQYPVGTERDVKYYQIFRRRSIHEPFMCIAELDFDNSSIKSRRTEIVDRERRIKYKKHVSFFEDPEFRVSDRFIYAIAAIDAHGLSSGYGAQSEVSFDIERGVLKLKRISPPGAPKQYPNFYIDPDEDENIFINTLTQDSIKSSGFNRIDLYFDPDAYTVKNVGNQGRTKRVFPFVDDGFYKLIMLDVDRQKGDSFEVIIEDGRLRRNYS